MSTSFSDTFSEEIFNQTYSYKGENVNETHARVARALASVEKPENQEKYAKEFEALLSDFKFVPGGRILSNAGTGIRGTSLINCFTPDTPVLTSKGYKKIVDVCIGDLVLTHKGRWRRVNGTMVKHYIGKIHTYIIPTSYAKHSSNLYCTPNHRFYDAITDCWIESAKNNQLSRAFGDDTASPGKYNFVQTLEYTHRKRYATGYSRQYFDMGNTSYIDTNVSVLDIASRFIGEYDKEYRHYDHGLDAGEKSVSVNVTSPSEDVAFFLPDAKIVVEMAQVYTEASDGKQFTHVCNNPEVNQAVRQVAYAELLRGRLPAFIWECSRDIQKAFLEEFGSSSEHLDCMPRNVCDELSVLRTIVTTNKKTSLIEYDFQKCTDTDYDGLVYNLSVKEDNSYVVHGVIVKNCFVSGAHGHDIDSMDGILDELRRQAHILKSEGGYGFCADFMRPRGAFIEGIAGEGPGAVKMAEMWDTQSAVITSGSGQKTKNPNAKGKIRKGAQMITMSAWHPDIEEFITAKQTPGRLTKFNMSVLVSDAFMEAIKNHQPWNLEFPNIHANAEVYKSEWTGDLRKWKEAGYPTEVYKTFADANELWNLIMESTYNRNEPGVLFVDTMNRRNNLWYTEHINATNPCLTGDTMVLTDEGYYPITELVGRQFNAVVGNKVYPSTPEGFWSTGVKPVYKITLQNGMTIRATGNHKFRTVKKAIGWKDVFVWEETSNIQTGESLLLSISSKYAQEIKNERDYEAGFTAGMSIVPGYLEKFKMVLFNTRAIPVIPESKEFDFIKGFVGGVFSTLGEFVTDRDFPEIRVPHNEQSVLFSLQRLLLWLGVISSVEDGMLKIKSLDCIRFVDAGIEIRDYNYTRRDKLIELVRNFRYINASSQEHSKVVSIEEDGEEEVFDCTIPEAHCFSANGILSHNCGEQILPIGGVCLLGSLNLTQFVDRAEGTYDWAKLCSAVETAVRLLDNVNDYTYVPLPEQRESLKTKRRIGLGVMGYGSSLMMLKKRYGSAEALELTHKLMATIRNRAYTASVNLAKEKGAFPLFDAEKYLTGPTVQALPLSIQTEIQMYGIRNSHLLSIQPTGNTAVVSNNVSGGLEPLFMPEYTRTTIFPHPPDGLVLPRDVDWTNRNFTPVETNWEWSQEGDDNVLKTAERVHGFYWKYDQQRGLLRETEVKDYAVRALGDEWNPGAEWAVTALNGLTVKDHVDTMNVFAMYVDSAMSKTVNVPNDYAYEDFKNLYKNAFDTGVIKGITTYRSGTMAFVLSETKSDKDQKAFPSKRPESIDCDISYFKSGRDNEQFVVLTGLIDNKPYEVFAFKQNKILLTDKIDKGQLVKTKIETEDGERTQYNLVTDFVVIEDLPSHFENDEQSALTRMISVGLRNQADINEIYHQLTSCGGTVGSFARCIARTLSKYVTEIKETKCEECGDPNGLIFREGCLTCKNCAWSKCG